MKTQLLVFYLRRVGHLFVAALMLTLFPASVKADGIRTLFQDRTVSVTGTVSTASGESLPGVGILLKGSNTGTVTDAEGKYTINAPDDGVLVFSSIGYAEQEVAVNGRSTINVTLMETALSLEEVVVIGYGTESTKKLTTAVAKVTDEEFADMPINNVADAFTGNISGVMVENASGAPGADPIIRIRGFGSINAGSEPLYVIDGLMVTSEEFGLLNPKSIESVSVLKDAAAGAIYGSRAGNGVIIVTTKGGEGKTKFSFNSTVGFQQVAKKIDVLSGPEYVEYAKRAYEVSGEDAPVFSDQIANTNWQDEIFRTGVFQNHQISANGGNESLKYNLSLNYLSNKGIIITTFEDSYSSNGKFDITLSKKLNLGLNYVASYSKSRVNDKLTGPAHGGGGIIEDAVVQYPVIPVYMENGDYGQANSLNWGTPVVYGGYGNPVAGLKEVHDMRNSFNGLARTFLNYEPVRGLNLNASFGGFIDSRFGDFHESPYLAANGHNREANFSNPHFEDIVAGQSSSVRSSYTVEGFIDYKRTFSGVHNFSIIGGGSKQFTGFRATNANAAVNDRGANAENPLPRFDNYYRPNIFGANDVSGSGAFSEETFTSMFARLNYDFKDKYLFMASIRRDGSSKFAPGNRYGVFPAVSGAWRISEEPFMSSSELFSDLKLRLSYGVSGNDQIGNYAWQGNYNYGNQYIYGAPGVSEGAVTTVYPTSIENPDLKWETNEQYNLGLDFTILNDRVQLSSNLYVRNTEDLLLNRPLPAENGIATSIMDNIGSMTNKGIELALTTTNVRKGDFSWTTNWIFNKVWNKVNEIHTESGILRLSSGDYNMIWIIEGEEMFQIYGYKTIGVFKNAEQLTEYPTPRGSKIGDPIYDEVVDDKVLNSDDYQKLGSALPSFTFGWSNAIRFKNWELNLVIDGSQGASKYVPAFRNQSWVSPIEGNVASYIYDRAGKVYGQPNLDYTGNRLEASSYHVFDASYVRIKNLALAYNLPQAFCDAMSITGLRLVLSAQDLHTFTSYPWFNPQANYFMGGAGSAFGVDYGGYPLSKTYSFGINLTF